MFRSATTGCASSHRGSSATRSVSYTVASIDREKLRAAADIKITNQDGTLVAVATHLLKWVKNK